MTVTDQPHHLPPVSDTATLREVYALVESTRVQLSAQIDKLGAQLDNEITKLGTQVEGKFTVHQVEHQQDRDRRSGLIRWAVTSIVSGVGVLVAIWLNLKGGS